MFRKVYENRSRIFITGVINIIEYLFVGVWARGVTGK